MRIEYLRRENLPGLPVPTFLHAVRLLDARNFFFPSDEIDERGVALFCADCLRKPDSYFKRSTTCSPPRFLPKSTNQLSSRLTLTNGNSIILDRATDLGLRDQGTNYVFTLRESFNLGWDGVLAQCRLTLTSPSKVPFLDRRRREVIVVSSVELANLLLLELRSVEIASELQAVFDMGFESLRKSLFELPINRWTYMSKRDGNEYPIPWAGQIPSEFYNDLWDLTGKVPAPSPKLATYPHARMEWSSKSPYLARPAESTAGGSAQAPRQSTFRSEPVKTTASAVFRYKNAPQEAVNDCVKALQKAGVKCDPSSFEADIDRIITGEMMLWSVVRQMSEMSRETVEKLAEIVGPDSMSAFDTNSKVAGIITSTLGPWLS